MDPGDPSLAEKLQVLKAQRVAVNQEVGLLGSSTSGTRAVITDAKIERFAMVMRQAMHNDDPAFRKAYLRMFVSEIVVETDKVNINGPRSALATAVGRDLEPSAIDGAQIHREWRPVGDSNPCYRRERDDIPSIYVYPYSLISLLYIRIVSPCPHLSNAKYPHILDK